MRNALFVFAIVLTLATGQLTHGAKVQAAETQTRIYGVVTSSKGLPSVGAKLELSCVSVVGGAASGAVGTTTTTDAIGHYEAFFNSSECSIDEHLIVYASNDGDTGGAQGTVTSANMELNLTLLEGHLGYDNNDIYASGSVSGVSGESNVEIVATCAGNPSAYTTFNPYANEYYVTFDPSSCTEGSSVTVKVTQGQNTGIGHGTIANGSAGINVSLVKVEAVPEIGSVAAIASLALVGGAIVYARRRQMQPPIV